MIEPARKSHARVYGDDGHLVLSPGEMIFAELKKQGFSQKELAVRLNRSEKFVSQLITGKVRLTYDVCYDLERVLHISAHDWNQIEAKYQEVLTEQKHKEQMRQNSKALAWARTYPYDSMAERGQVPQTNDEVERALNLLSYFQVSSYEAFENALVSDKTSKDFFEKLNKAKIVNN